MRPAREARDDHAARHAARATNPRRLYVIRSPDAGFRLEPVPSRPDSSRGLRVGLDIPLGFRCTWESGGRGGDYGVQLVVRDTISWSCSAPALRTARAPPMHRLRLGAVDWLEMQDGAMHTRRTPPCLRMGVVDRVLPESDFPAPLAPLCSREENRDIDEPDALSLSFHI